MPTTPAFALPYPAGTDSPDMAYWNQQLALAVEAMASANLPVSVVPAASSAISTVQTTVATLPAIATGGTRPVEVTFDWYNLVASVASGTFFLKLYRGATFLRQQLVVILDTNVGGGSMYSIDTPPSGSHIYTIQMVRNSGTSTLSLAVGALLAARSSG